MLLTKILSTIKNFLWHHVTFVLCFVVVAVVAALLILFKQDEAAGSLFEALYDKFGHTKQGSNTVLPSRNIPVGQDDSRGYAQQQVQDLKVSNNPLRDRTSVTLPDGDKVQLPTGLKDTQVDTIIETKTDITVTSDPSNTQKAADTQQVLDNAKKTDAAAQDLLNQLTKGK